MSIVVVRSVFKLTMLCASLGVLLTSNIIMCGPIGPHGCSGDVACVYQILLQHHGI